MFINIVCSLQEFAAELCGRDDSLCDSGRAECACIVALEDLRAQLICHVAVLEQDVRRVADGRALAGVRNRNGRNKVLANVYLSVGGVLRLARERN